MKEIVRHSVMADDTLHGTTTPDGETCGKRMSLPMTGFLNPFVVHAIITLSCLGLTTVGKAQHTGTISPMSKFTIHSEILDEDRTYPFTDRLPWKSCPAAYHL